MSRSNGEFLNNDLRFSIKALKDNWDLLKDPDYFRPHGIRVFSGEQGTGKTIALVKMLTDMRKRYPKAIVVSNIELLNMKACDFEDDAKKLAKILVSPDFDTVSDYIPYRSKTGYELVNKLVVNDKYGVILVTDEYQNYFSNQDSKNVPPWVLEQAAQNRKNRRVHLVTSQDYDQLAKAIRRRSFRVYKCRSYSLLIGGGAILTTFTAYNAKDINKVLDGTMKRSDLRKIGTGRFFHKRELRESYDTYQVIFTGDSAPGVYMDEQRIIQMQSAVSKRRNRIKKTG